MVSAEQAAIVNELVDDALAAGAERICGGPAEMAGSPGNHIAPTVLTGVTHEMRIMREEIFGPVLPIVVVADEDEALRLANDSDFGLGASIWTRSRPKGERMARRLAAGMVWINDHAYTHAAVQCAWGGVKDSGLGRSHSQFGFYECANDQDRHLEQRPQPRLLVASLRRDPRPGDPLERRPPLRRRRPEGQGPSRRCAGRC